MPPQRRRNTEATKPASASTAEERPVTVEATAPATLPDATESGAGSLEPPAQERVDEQHPPAGDEASPSPLDPPTGEREPDVDVSPSPLDPPVSTEAPRGSRQVLDSPVAPLDAPVRPSEPPAPAPQPPVANGERLGYVDDEGNPIRIADVFDLSGDKLLVTAKTRVHLRFRRPGITTVLQSLLYPAGDQVHRAVATQLIAEEKATAAAEDE
ncbi:hypothetical protein JNW90_01415 [Micromonospora sp. STR1s_5]|nr:hypothetical protein [Micromonospora sp. STR1s_5]